ncbi:hypothetical protein OF83DRAFT_1167875 [Amylostereum chailletii]|nr:hypothetical protein OF83DRAFT_1167875 [Amylostereum chailletii]
MFKQLALAAFIMHSAAATPLVIRDDVPDVQQQKDQFTRAHNSIRARFGAAPLGWGDELRGAAHQWATQCTCRHSPSGPFGEIITASSTNIPIETVVEARWANHTGMWAPVCVDFGLDGTGVYTRH